MTLRVGQAVVLVREINIPLDATHYNEFPVTGVIYTVAEVDGLSIALNEIAFHQIGEPAMFFADRFRPIVKTDISIFQAMLAPSPKQAEKVE